MPVLLGPACYPVLVFVQQGCCALNKLLGVKVLQKHVFMLPCKQLLSLGGSLHLYEMFTG